MPPDTLIASVILKRSLNAATTGLGTTLGVRQSEKDGISSESTAPKCCMLLNSSINAEKDDVDLLQVCSY